MWPFGGMPSYKVKGKISANHRFQEGRALCVWRDAGWGQLVSEGKYLKGHFDDDLVDALVSLFKRWIPQPEPSWITCIPSLRHPALVPDLARRLADRLPLPFHQVFTKTDSRPEQKSMVNSIQQARNIDGSLALKQMRLPSGSVLLIDYMVDSRWTMTVASWLLRSAGSGEVFPLALALTAHG
jgi:ATP-dependent DNA helicase RecQ